MHERDAAIEKGFDIVLQMVLERASLKSEIQSKY